MIRKIIRQGEATCATMTSNTINRLNATNENFRIDRDIHITIDNFSH